MTNSEFQEFAHARFAALGWLERSGAFIYTSPASVSPCRNLIIATNPGGSVKTHAAQTIGRSLDEFADRVPNWSAWFNEGGWGSTRLYPEPGSAPLQKCVARVLTLLGSAGVAGPKVCSTELIFLRSQSTGKLDGNFDHLADDCWPINEYILREVQPQQLILIGNGESMSPWSFLQRKFAVSWSRVRSVSYGRGSAKLKVAEFLFDGRTVLAIGFPHFSRFGVPGDLSEKLDLLGVRP